MANEDKQEELRRLIEQLPPQEAAWVGLRAALRVLPVLVEAAPSSSGLSAEKFQTLLLASFRACQCADAAP